MKKEETTRNITAPNYDLEVLKKHFSHCFDKDGKFDFEKFKRELSQSKKLGFSKESYSMDWLGKSYARLLANDAATTLLKEDKAWNAKKENRNSGNLLIKGDNLEVLKHLSHAYHEKVKMIYVDPPYNTGSDDFAYEDNRKFSVAEFQKLAGVDEEQAKRVISFITSKRNSHSAWLTFMYPRLYIAKQLLKEDGVIFISIDDNEVAQLRLLMDEVFGEENFITSLYVEMSTTQGMKVAAALKGAIVKNAENVLVYSKNKNELKFSEVLYSKRDWDDHYSIYFDKKLGKKGNSLLSYIKKESQHFGSIIKTTKNIAEYYETDTDFREYIHKISGNIFQDAVCDIKMNLSSLQQQRLDDGEIISYGSESKEYLLKKTSTGKIRQLISLKLAIGTTDDFEETFGIRKIRGNWWAYYYKDMMNINKEGGVIFKNGKKPVRLVRDILKISTSNNDIILDFFAGSGTTGDAVMKRNAEDGGNRKYILVQLPEVIVPKKNKEAYDFVKDELKVKNPTIFEITKERLVRAAKKIQKEQQDLFSKDNLQDFGFKVFETIPIWEDYQFEADKFDPQAKLFNEKKLTPKDIQTLLCTWKTHDELPLTQDLQEITFGAYVGYYAAEKLYLMNEGFETKHLKLLLKRIDGERDFNPTSIIVFGYFFESKALREIAENVSSYANKKGIDIDLIVRY